MMGPLFLSALRREILSRMRSVANCPYTDPSPIASTPVFVRRGNDCSHISGLMLTSINRGPATMGYWRASSPLLSRERGVIEVLNELVAS